MVSIVLGLVMSFFIAGLGIAYSEDLRQGIGIILLWSILTLIAIFAQGQTAVVVGALALCVWAYSMIATFLLTAKN